MSAKESYIMKTARVIHPTLGTFTSQRALKNAKRIESRSNVTRAKNEMKNLPNISDKTHEEAVALGNKNKSFNTPGATPISSSPDVQSKKGIGAHFKKHWPGYAAVGTAGVIGGSYLKGNKKNDQQTSVPAQTV